MKLIGIKGETEPSFGIGRMVTALTIFVIVFAAIAGVLAVQNSSILGGKKESSPSVYTITVTSTTTVTANQITLPANVPTSCITNYPDGLDLNYTNYFLLTNPSAVVAQICIRYTYEPQQVWGLAAQQITNGTMNANFSFGAAIMYQNSFGNASQGGPLPLDVVSPNPPFYVFNSAGQSVVVDYTISWLFIYSQFIPAYIGCTSSMEGIGVALNTGPGTSGIKSTCPNGSIGSMFDAELAGTSYLKLETSQG